MTHLQLAAKSTRQENEVRKLLRAKLEAKDAYDARRLQHGMQNAGSVSMEDRIEQELEIQRLWSVYWEAELAVAAYNRQHGVAT